MNQNLITNLTDIVGSYTDEKTYDNLINIEPKFFNKKKFIKNILNDVPISNLDIMIKAYKLSEEWIKDEQIYDNPLEIVGSFIKLIRMYGDMELDKFKMKRYKINGKNESELYSLDQVIYSITDDLDDDIHLNIDINDLYLNISDEYKQKFVELAELKNCDIDVTAEEFGIYFARQIKKLVKLDPEFHFMTNLEKYKDKLLEMVIKSLEEQPVIIGELQ
jgi:hypothetical protein